MEKSVSEKVVEILQSVLPKIAVKKENIWLSSLNRASPLMFYLATAIAVINVFLFLSLAIRMSRFDPVIILVLFTVLYPLLFSTWKNLIAWLDTSSFFKRSFALPSALLNSISSLVLALCAASLVGGLVWGISTGSVVVVIVGFITSLFLYQLFSVLMSPECLGISFEEPSRNSVPLIFVDWLILKLLMLFLFMVEISIVAMAITPFVLAIDLIRAWSFKTPGLVYTAALFHQGLWIGALVIPLVGYFALLGWIFGWELLKRIWDKTFERKE